MITASLKRPCLIDTIAASDIYCFTISLSLSLSFLSPLLHSLKVIKVLAYDSSFNLMDFTKLTAIAERSHIETPTIYTPDFKIL